MSFMTPEQIQGMADTVSDPNRIQDLQDQLQAAHKLRQKGVPAMTQVGNSAFANTGGIIANALDNYRGKMDEDKSKAALAGIYSNQGKQAGSWFNARYPQNQPPNPNDPNNVGSAIGAGMSDYQ